MGNLSPKTPESVAPILWCFLLVEGWGVDKLINYISNFVILVVDYCHDHSSLGGKLSCLFFFLVMQALWLGAHHPSPQDNNDIISFNKVTCIKPKLM